MSAHSTGSTFQIAGYQILEQLANILLYCIQGDLESSSSQAVKHALSTVLVLLSNQEYEVRKLTLQRLLEVTIRYVEKPP